MTMNRSRIFTATVTIICLALCIVIAYWTIQRTEVAKAAQSGLNSEFKTKVHINKIGLEQPGGFPSKWISLLFHRHDWFVEYSLPHEDNATTVGTVEQNSEGRWVYKQIAPSWSTHG